MFRTMCWLLTVGTAVGTGACGYNYTASRSVNVSRPAPECDFAVQMTPPSEGYEEIGILDAKAAFWAERSAAEFKDSVQEQVCAHGGELVVPQFNGQGKYVRAAVMRRVTAATADHEKGQL